MIEFRVPTGLCDELIDFRLPKSNLPGIVQNLNGWILAALQQEPDVADHTQRGAVTRWMGYVFGNPRITRLQALALLPIEPTDPNPFFMIVDSVTREGGSLRVGNSPMSLASCAPIVRAYWHRVEYAVAMVLTGGDVIGMDVFFEVNPAGEVPPSFPQSSINGNVLTWREWTPETQPFTEINGKIYRSSNLPDGSRNMHASEWVPYYLSGGVVINAESFVALRDET